MISDLAASGRVKKMEKSPRDIIRDLRRLFSMSGPGTEARTRRVPSLDLPGDQKERSKSRAWPQNQPPGRSEGIG